MVVRKTINKKYALISVFDKNKLNYLCKNLKLQNYEFISTGSTCAKIKSLGYNCKEISAITKFKEMLDGRVKTLNQKIYASLLHKRENKKHVREFKKLNFPDINLVVVNLYPFKKSLNSNNEDKIIEMIDIGGVSLIRAASKNFKYVTTICDMSDYSFLIKEINKNKGNTSIGFRKIMAQKAFKITADYDAEINKWLGNKNASKNKFKLRYGENPNQKSYIEINKNNSIFDYQINGKEISYNNIIDVDSGLRCLSEFSEPTTVILKHTNPCGVASSENINTSFKRAYDADPKSAFGGVVLLNRSVNLNLANKIFKSFFEIIVAPGFEKSALNLLKKKSRLILLKIKNNHFDNFEVKSTSFGNIFQSSGLEKINKNFISHSSSITTTNKYLSDLIFSLKVVRHLKSNAIVLSKNKQTVGLGIGQTNRIDSLKIALNRKKISFKASDFVCASDGFFPFIDGLKLLRTNGCRAIAQPSGSINDKKIISYAIQNNLPLYFTKNRLFKH